MKLRRVTILAASIMVAISTAGISQAQPDEQRIEVREGATQPVFSRVNAIVESVYVPAEMDSDSDGERDRIALDIIRPAETAGGLRVPTVMQASPYYDLAGTAATANGTRIPMGFDRWYDDYFVPRGYAVVEVEMQGTSRSTGCPATGGPEDTRSVQAAIDWLNGRTPGYRADGSEVRADWSTGKVGMVGVSYNGTLPNAAAAAGVDGLTTIVPIAAISSWYDYARDQGIGYRGAWGYRYPEWLGQYVVSRQQRPACREVLTELGNDAADGSYDYTPFYQARNYRDSAEQVKASVFVVHGQEDWNVKPNHFSRWWEVLAEQDVPRKLWLHREAHTDPISVRPREWQRQIAAWMDYWLQGIDNGIMDEPMVDLQRPDGHWETYRDWPAPEAKDSDLWLERYNRLLPTRPDSERIRRFTDDLDQSENMMVAEPDEERPHRLAFTTRPLQRDLRISGTPSLRVKMAADRTGTPLTALLVDYGPNQPLIPQDKTPAELFATSCTLRDVAERTGCAEPSTMLRNHNPYSVVTRGSIDTRNRNGLTEEQPLQPGLQYEVDWQTHPKDYVFPAGHRIGVVLVANDESYIATDAAGATVLVTLGASKLTLPVAGGPPALAQALGHPR
ncbi:Xaa-Pro dipeptidyl-peptidase [Amycolatopsis aidingensis]|uniref:Xaa-Pro dipeptidyl-peptidase n=1 Tax=Amycolatopsis aidingensis TaxID=2842453 RepID=UPI001C0BF90A|nr:Xaa-Pro dipeptidyl-peptidase [Amycolatopsis aidingensis]